jgi:lipoprotein-anchoring transpeptidase ErfK/SrfK
MALRTSTRPIALIAALLLTATISGALGAVRPGHAHASIESEAATPERNVPGLAAPVVEPVQVSATPTEGASQVNPAAPVSLKVAHGQIERASLTSASGESIEGKFDGDSTTWTADGQLSFNTAYTFSYAVRDAAGRETSKTSSFSTVTTANEADAALYPLDGMKVGVAQPLQITFSEPVVNKEAVEKAIRITTTSGQTGAFHWFSDKMVRYRPEAFWAANSTVTMDMKLFGVDLGRGQIGNFDKKVTIHIGDKKVAVADATAHTMTVSVNDQPAGSWPVTMGDTRFPSARGYLVLMENHRVEHMDAGTIGLKPGDPAYYGQLDVNYATRLTPSGEYIHQATDTAMPYLGQTNLSHGCIGMSEAGAKWVFENMIAGDVVQVVNTEGDYAAVDDGYGDWNIPWAEYAKR